MSGTRRRQIGFEAQIRLLEKWSSQVNKRREERKKQSPPVWWNFTEKWDSDHPTTCCVWTRTRIERSFCPEVEDIQRKIVTEDEVDAVTWECAVDNDTSEIACKMHAEI